MRAASVSSETASQQQPAAPNNSKLHQHPGNSTQEQHLSIRCCYKEPPYLRSKNSSSFSYLVRRKSQGSGIVLLLHLPEKNIPNSRFSSFFVAAPGAAKNPCSKGQNTISPNVRRKHHLCESQPIETDCCKFQGAVFQYQTFFFLIDWRQHTKLLQPTL